jgi:DNA-binding CsgD family transcriptional regulator
MDCWLLRPWPGIVVDVLCPVVVGRQAELETLAAALGDALGGRGRCVFLTGEPGIGKSRLAREVAVQAAAAGAAVVVGRGVPAGASAPYRPLTEALLQALRGRPMPGDASLAPWLPALGAIVPGTGGIERGAEASPAIRGEAVVQLLRHIADPRGMVVVLEDLHWADPDTIAVVEYLAGNLAGLPVLGVATVRSETSSPALSLARRQRGLLGSTHLALERLDAEHAALMVRACFPEAGRDEIARVQRTAEGVPLLIEEVLASPGVPSSFADTVRERLGEFRARERAVIDGAAVLGRIFDWRLLAPMTGVTPEFAGDVLARGIDRQILSSDGISFRFRHALTREAVLSVVLPPRQQALAAAGLSVLSGAAGPAGLVPGSAWHDLAADLAARAGDRPRAAILLTESGRAALERGALATAVDTLRRAAELSDGVRTGAEPLLVEALALAGRVDEAATAGKLLIARLAEHPGTAELRADVHLALAHAAATAYRWPMARSNVEEARKLLGASPAAPVAARMAVLEAEAALAADDNAGASRLARKALESGAAAAEVRCHALEIIGRAERPHDQIAARAAFGQALETANAAELPLWRLRALHELGTIDLYDHAGTERLLAARRTADELGVLSTAAFLDIQLSAAYACRWMIDKCAAYAQSAATLAGQLGLARLRAMALCSVAHCHAFQGDAEQTERIVALAWSAGPRDAELEALCSCAKGMIPLTEGDRRGAIEALSPGMTILARLPHAVPAAFRAVWPLLLASVGDERGAAAITEARRLGVGAFRLNRGMLGYAEAIMAGRAGDKARALQIAAEADRDFVNCETWGHLARTLAAEPAYADGWGQPEHWLADSRAAFAGHDLHRLAAWCGELLAGPPTVWAGLGVTDREADVLKLVAEGLANKQIAARLRVSPRTVEKHIEALLRKTSARSRTQLAVLAAQAPARAARRNT